MSSKGGEAGLVNATEIWRQAGRPSRSTPTAFRRTPSCRLLVAQGERVSTVRGHSTWFSPRLAEAYIDHLRLGSHSRAHHDPRGAAASGAAPDPAARTAEAKLAEAVRTAYRRMSLKYHPDRGGDTRSQAVVNEVFELIERLTRAA
jgi:hypothetical protein